MDEMSKQDEESQLNQREGLCWVFFLKTVLHFCSYRSVFAFFLSGTILHVLTKGKPEEVPVVMQVAFRRLTASTREEMICGLQLNSKAANPCGQAFKFSVKRRSTRKKWILDLRGADDGNEPQQLLGAMCAHLC